MRVIAVLTFLLISATAYSQSTIDKFLDSTITYLKTQSQIDKNDLAVFSVLENFYNEALQSDRGELSSATAQKINSYAADDKMKNKHLLILFLMYQEHISQTAAQGKSPNAEYQLACINQLEKELLRIYQKVPVIVYIYKAEALESAGHNERAKNLIDASLKRFPGSIPLKVYKYLDSRDENIKSDLVKHHSQHWMVQQFGIK